MKDLFLEMFQGKELIYGILSNKRKKTQEIERATFRPIELKGESLYQLEYIKNKKAIHENLTFDEFVFKVKELTTLYFKRGNFFTTSEDIQFLASKADNIKIIKSKPTKSSMRKSHNKDKNYIIPDGEPCDFLIHLGIMGKDGKVYKSQFKKFKQINRFLELVSDCLKYIDAKAIDENTPMKIVDFGCGKAYLTFALYYMFAKKMKLNVHIVGLDLKEDVIDFCSSVATHLNYHNLYFQVGDIATFKETSCNMVVSLHACDTATDYALINAVNWKSDVIISVPCCQHELFSQIDNPLLNPILKYGISKDKFTETLTNGLRALMLESNGYKVDMVEFTSLEHTAKNVVIRGTLNKNPSLHQMESARMEYEKLKSFFNVFPTIEKMK